MKRSALLLVVLACTCGTTAHAQTGEDALRLSGRQAIQSPVGLSMAGVGNAGMGSFSDLFQNPAGLALMGASSFDVGITTVAATDDAMYSIGSTGSPVSTDVSRAVLNHLSWSYRFPTSQGSLVVAAGFSRRMLYDREMTYDGLNPSNSITDYFMPVPGEFELLSDDQGVYPDFSRTLSFIAYETYAIDLDPDAVEAGAAVPFLPAVTTGTVRQTGIVSDKGALSELSFGGAMEAAKGVTVGLSVNIPFGEYTYLRIHDEDDIDDANDGSAGTTDFGSLRFTESFTSHVAGVNVRAGLSAVVAPGLRVGLTIESPAKLSVSEDYTTQLSTEFDNGDRFDYGDSANEDAGAGTFDYEVKTPWRTGIGLAFTRGPISVFGDATLVDWSSLELTSEGYAFLDENIGITQSLKATVSTRLGLAYRTGDLTLRGGFAVDPDPHAAAFADVDGSRTTVGAGASYAVSRQFALDFAWSMERFEDAFDPYVEVAGAPWVTEEVSRHFVQLGLRMTF